MKKLNLEIEKTIAIISDTHFGAKHSLFPPEFRTENDNHIKANAGQLRIYNHWRYFLSRCNEFNVDTVIHLGDVVHGINKKSKTTLFSRFDDQIKLAVEMLSEITKNRKFFLVAGSQFHESIEFEIGNVIASKLNGEFLGYIANIEIGFCKKNLNIAHSAGSPMIYTATVMDREMLFYKLAEAKGILKRADWIIRGHLHSYGHQDNSKIHTLLVPCWCGYEPIKDVKLFGKRQPDIGGIILIVDKEGRIIPLHFLMDKIPQFYSAERGI
ncbi:MAG TPA: metallophosphoesterase [Victivallales bacterium]|nr:metallophosphoesterase [Victivallales bacterium]